VPKAPKTISSVMRTAPPSSARRSVQQKNSWRRAAARSHQSGLQTVQANSIAF